MIALTQKILTSPWPVKKRRKPFYTGRAGDGSRKVFVPVYGPFQTHDPQRLITRTSYIIAWTDFAGRHLEKRANPAKAKQRADELAQQLNQQPKRFAQFLSERQEAALQMILETCDRGDWTLDQAAGFLDELEKLCCEFAMTPLEVLAAARAQLQVNKQTNIVRKTCPQIYEELLAARRAEEAGPRWIDDLESRLGRFIKEFTGSLADVRADDLRAWLARLNLSKRSANNYRTAIVALVAFAKERRYLPKDWDELDAVKPHKIKKGREELYSPREIRSLLYTAEKHFPQHVATLAIMAFAGCRHSELRDEQNALDWSDVHLATAQIHIDEELAKSNTGRRYVPLQPNLVAWLKPYEKARGPVCNVNNLTNALARIAERAQVKWKQNALRNSYISYRCAVTHDVARVAGEAGNSVGEIHKSYRKEIPEAEGQKWWEIWPTREDDLPLFSGRPR